MILNQFYATYSMNLQIYGERLEWPTAIECVAILNETQLVSQVSLERVNDRSLRQSQTKNLQLWQENGNSIFELKQCSRH